MDHFVGAFGKGNSWCLVSDCPFIVEDKKKHEFISVKTIEEAAKFYGSDGLYTVYVWKDGLWNEVHFLPMLGKPSNAIRFRPG